jgi:hypothetical protein
MAKELEDACEHALKLSSFYRQLDNDPRYNSSARPRMQRSFEPYSTATAIAAYASSTATRKWRSKSVVCFKCGEMGHYKNECTSESPDEVRRLIASVAARREERELPITPPPFPQTVAARHVQLDETYEAYDFMRHEVYRES